MNLDFEPKDSAEAVAKREALGKHLLQEKREQMRAEEKVAARLDEEINLSNPCLNFRYKLIVRRTLRAAARIP